MLTNCLYVTSLMKPTRYLYITGLPWVWEYPWVWDGDGNQIFPVGIPIWVFSYGDSDKILLHHSSYGFQYGFPNGSHGDLQCIADILILKTKWM